MDREECGDCLNLVRAGSLPPLSGWSLCGQGGVWWLFEPCEGWFPAAFVRVVFVWTGRSVVTV